MLKVAHQVRKKGNTPNYGNRCSFDQKRKGCPYKAGMNRLKSYKSSNLLLWKIILLKIVTNNSDSLLPATNVPNRWWSFSSIPAYDQNSVLNFVEIEQLFSSQEAMCSYNKTQVPPYDPTKPAFHFILRPEDVLISISGQNSKKLYLPMTLCTSLMRRTSWPLRIWIVVLLSTLKLLQKSDRSTENGITLSDPKKNPNAFPVTINITVLLMRGITLMSFWTRTVYGTWFQQLLCHSNTIRIDTLCPMKTLNQQLTNQEQTHIRCSLQCEGWTVKGRDCASALHSFNEITYQTDEWTKQLLRLKSWVISGNSEPWMEFRRLWWTVILIRCSYLFHLFEFYYLLVRYL